MALLHAASRTYRIDGILFDKDGTLMDFIHTWGNWSERLIARFSSSLRARNLPPIGVDPGALWGTCRAADGTVVDYDRDGPLAMGTVDEMLAILAWQGYRSGLSWAEAKTLAAQCKRSADERLELERTVRLLPGVLPFLESCRRCGLRLAVVTADETAAAEKHLEWLGIRGFFSAVIGTDRVERGKPFPDMALLANRQLGLEGGQIAVIGDTNGDMRMAKSAGAAAAIGIAAAGGAAGSSHLSEADTVIASFRELSVTQEEHGA